MGFAATAQNQKRDEKAKHAKAAPAPDPSPEPETILGVDLKGELLDIALARVFDPDGPSDRLPRPDDAQKIDQLARSIRETGQLQPVMLEQLADGRYCRVFGRRRIAALRKLGRDTVRAVVVPPLPEDVRRSVVAVENVQRQDLTAAEETLAVAELMELQALKAAVQYAKPLSEVTNVAFAAEGFKTETPAGVTITQDAVRIHLEKKYAPKEESKYRRVLLADPGVRRIASELVAAMLGKTAEWVRDRMYIGRLSDNARKLVLEEKITLAHAREIAKVADPVRRDQLAKAYAAGGSDSISDTEPGKLEELQEEVRRCVFSLAVVPWNLAVAFAGKPACDGCPHNSNTNPGLFETGAKDVSTQMVGGRGTYDSAEADSKRVQEAGVCTLPSCYETKNRAAKVTISSCAKRIVEQQSAKPKKGAKTPPKVQVPAFVDAGALRKKVEDRRKLGPAKKRGMSMKVDTKAWDAAKAKEDAIREAGYKLNAALQRRAQEFEEALVSHLAKTPGSLAMFHVLKETKAYQAAQGDSPKSKKQAVLPAFRELIQRVSTPSLENLIKLESAAGLRFNVIDEYNDADSGMLDTIADVLGVQIPKAPSLEQFLPEKYKAKPAETKPGKQAPKSGKGTPIVDDGEDQ